jgi:hypothetical protein
MQPKGPQQGKWAGHLQPYYPRIGSLKYSHQKKLDKKEYIQYHLIQYLIKNLIRYCSQTL